MNKISVSLLFFLIAFNCFSATKDSLIIEKITKHLKLEVTQAWRLSYNHAPYVKNIYAIEFVDKSFRLYDDDEDTLSKSRYFHFISDYNSWLGLVNDKWRFFKESKGNWELRHSFDKVRFDSIKIISQDHYIGFKNRENFLFHFKYNSDTPVGFNKISYLTTDNLKYYDKGIFVRLLSEDENSNGKIAYLDFETGQPKSNFLADSILNYPTPFVHFSLVQSNGHKLVYSYSTNQIIENAFKKSYVVPMYFYPLIITKKYIGLGDKSEWKRFKAKRVKSITFESYGDYVIGIMTEKRRKKQYIDLRRKRIIDEKKYLHITAPTK